MSKLYDLYPSYERKIDNWRRRILRYEKMKRDLQRQIQILRNKNKKQKEGIDKAINYILKETKSMPTNGCKIRLIEILDILKEGKNENRRL